MRGPQNSGSPRSSRSRRPYRTAAGSGKRALTMNAPSSHLSELLALLAHDLRNPLSAVLTNVNFVKSTMRGRAPDIEEALGDSALSCATLGQVIGNLDVL